MGRNDRDVLGPWEALVLAAASFRLWRLAAEDTLLDVPRDRVLTRSPEWAEDLVDCPWCLGFWISLGACVSWRMWPRATLTAAAPFAVSAAVGLVAEHTRARYAPSMNEFTGRLDEVPTSHRPACAVCQGTLRRNHSTGIWRCDLHGEQNPVWVAVTADTEEGDV